LAAWPSRLTLPDGFPGVLLQTTDHTHASKEIQIVRKRRRIASILQLSQHLGVRQDLAGIPASQLEQAAQHCGFIDTRLQQNIARYCRLDQGVEDITSPALLAPDR
jgi:hypothetical protein